MKKSVLAVLALLVSTQVHALTCNIYRESAKAPGQYDQPVAEGIKALQPDVKQQVVLIRKDGVTVTNFMFEAYKSLEDLKKIDGSLFVVLSRTDDNTIAIGVGGLDISEANTNATTLSAMAFGSANKYLSVMDFKHKISVTCGDY